MDKLTLAKRVNDRCRLEGSFTLRSGQTASHYFDKYLFEGDPELLAAVVDHLVPLVPAGTEVVAGLELGGVPLATALSLATGINAAFVRKEAKAYGTARLAEGADVAGRRVLVVEDVITTGGQVASSTDDLRRLGATVEQVLCVIDRSDGSPRALGATGVEVTSVLTGADLDAAASSTRQRTAPGIEPSSVRPGD